jgi:hypothetical protein
MRRCLSTYLSLVRAALTDAGAFEAFYVSRRCRSRSDAAIAPVRIATLAVRRR